MCTLWPRAWLRLWLFVFSLYTLTGARTQVVISCVQSVHSDPALTQVVINCVQHVHSKPFQDSGSDLCTMYTFCLEPRHRQCLFVYSMYTLTSLGLKQWSFVYSLYTLTQDRIQAVTNYVQCVLSDPGLALAVISCVQNAHFDPGLCLSSDYCRCVQCVHSDQRPDSSSDRLRQWMETRCSHGDWSGQVYLYSVYIQPQKKLLPPRYIDTTRTVLLP